MRLRAFRTLSSIVAETDSFFVFAIERKEHDQRVYEYIAILPCHCHTMRYWDWFLILLAGVAYLRIEVCVLRLKGVKTLSNHFMPYWSAPKKMSRIVGVVQHQNQM